MQKTIIADSSCLILLDKIEELELLKLLFGKVIITSIIAEEFGNRFGCRTIGLPAHSLMIKKHGG
ncbi:MAG: hypothetical protein U5J96_08755 [Ignavibacteriaceae bacterium]|nr:hypothetical protein [Ignavibacteriaceae bacterium]